jgi:hypothetical protein
MQGFLSSGTLGFYCTKNIAIIDVSLPTVSECTNQINSLLDRGFKVDTYRGCFTGCLIMVKQQIMELNMPKNW